MRVLFTSASKPTALALARVLAAEGHTVHAADEERIWRTAPARYSRAYRQFYRLTAKFSLLELWKTIGDDIDLVIPFDPLPGAAIQSLKSRGAILFGETLAQNDFEFQDFVRDTIINASSKNPSIVRVPASFIVRSGTCIAEILSNRATSTFSLQPLPCYDTDDEDTLVDVGPAAASLSLHDPVRPLIISCSTLNDCSVKAIKRLPMSDARPYRLIEVAEGGSFYSTHAFVHSGKIRTFAVTTARSTDRDFVIVSPGQPLYEVLYQFTVRLVEELDSWQTVVANHLSLSFHVQDEVKYSDFIRKVTVVSCHNQPHSNLVLLSSITSLRKQLSLAYTLDSIADGDTWPVTFPVDLKSVPKAIYSAPLAVSEYVRILLAPAPWRWSWWTRLAHLTMICLVWTVNFKEEMWASEDPGPALCLWVAMLISAVGRMRCIGWVTQPLVGVGERAIVRFERSHLVRVIAATGFFLLDIWRLWFAMLLFPWYRISRR